MFYFCFGRLYAPYFLLFILMFRVIIQCLFEFDWCIVFWFNSFVNGGEARLCGSRVLSGGPLWLSGCPLLDRRQIGRVSDVGRKAWLVLGILVIVVRGLLGF